MGYYAVNYVPDAFTLQEKINTNGKVSEGVCGCVNRSPYWEI